MGHRLVGGGDSERQGAAEKAQAGAAAEAHEEGRHTDHLGNLAPEPFADGDHDHHGPMP